MTPNGRRQFVCRIAGSIVIALVSVATLPAEVTVVGVPWPSAIAASCRCEQVPMPQAPLPLAGELESPPLADDRIESFLATPALSFWYTKIEYMQWITRYGTEQRDDEHGELWTVGYQRRWGAERARLELFGGSMKYAGRYPYRIDDDGNVQDWVPNDASANHFGGRGEIEYLWDVEVEGGAPITLLAGLGTRLWNRDVSDGTTIFGDRSIGYGQTWWTIYPYVGSELRWVRNEWCEFFLTSRIGCTAINYLQMPEYWGTVRRGPKYPQAGLTGQIELGLRRKHFVAAATFEAMSWPRTEDYHRHGDASAQEYFWDGAEMYTTGLKLGFVW